MILDIFSLTSLDGFVKDSTWDENILRSLPVAQALQKQSRLKPYLRPDLYNAPAPPQAVPHTAPHSIRQRHERVLTSGG